MLKTAARQAQQLCEKLTVASAQMQHTRNTTIVKRMYPPRLYKQDLTGPFKPALKRRENVYIIEDRGSAPAGTMDIILTRDLEGYGLKGEVVNVPKRVARQALFPASAAVYINDENLALFASAAEERKHENRQSVTGLQTVRQLNGAVIPIPISADNPWTLNKTHIRVACRKIGLELKESCISLHGDPITEAGEIDFKITVNKLDTVDVKGFIYYHNKDPDVKPKLPRVFRKNKITLDEALESS